SERTAAPRICTLSLHDALPISQDESDDAVRAVPAVGLSDLGRDREGLALVLEALAGHLPRYRRSLAAYAHGLVEPGRDTAPASRSEEHTSELQSREKLVCRLPL